MWSRRIASAALLATLALVPGESTPTPDAFAQGLAYIYAFNFPAARAAFQRAAAENPAAAMPYWGLALALGPNFNAPRPGPLAERAATDALAQARTRAEALPPGPESNRERAYIEALTLRLSCAPRPNFPQLESAYGNAMRALSADYPDDPDAATLFAESLMEQQSWDLWHDGTPAPRTAEILRVLEAVLRRWPDHLGANHLLIHAAEASPDPSRALASARRLADLVRTGGFPGDGHLLHMPAHLYMRTGDYAAAESSTRAAADSDRAFAAAHAGDSDYIAAYGRHNLMFLVVASEMDGDFDAAMQTANALANFNAAAAEQPQPANQSVLPLLVLVRYGRWDEILALPQPGGLDTTYRAFWHFARGSALAATGDPNQSMRELMLLRAALGAPRITFGNPPFARTTLQVLLVSPLAARIAAARGQFEFAADQWNEAIAVSDQIGYREPPAWFPLRESLGAMYLKARQPGKAEAAFRACLAHWPNDPRALFGLAKALGAEGRASDAAIARHQFQTAWRGGPLALEEF